LFVVAGDVNDSCSVDIGDAFLIAQSVAGVAGQVYC
jgi:hypothetical protein